MIEEEVVNQDAAGPGLFDQSLKRNFKQIREDRADLMKKSTRALYKREIDDLYTELDTLEVDRNNLLDFAGDSTTHVLNPSDFDAKNFISRDKSLTMKAREISIQIEEYTKRFNSLFGLKYKREF